MKSSTNMEQYCKRELTYGDEHRSKVTQIKGKKTNTKATQQIMPPILLHWPMTSEQAAGDMQAFVNHW